MVPENLAIAHVYRSLGTSTLVIKLGLRRQSEEHFRYSSVSKQRQLKRTVWQKISPDVPIAYS
jgi:hypothetical protein